VTLTRDDPALAEPLREHAQLLDYFRTGEKPPERWRVGTEHEKIGLYADTLEPVPYEGERGIRALLAILEKEHGFAPLVDAGKVVGLERHGASITLEPGGQLELSGAPLHTLHETCKEFNDHITLLKHVSERLGIVWLGVGLHPFVEVDAAPRMPRERYSIMRDYLGRRDELGLHMMHMTAGVQANYDFASEDDLARKLRVALALSPLTTALWANSSVSGGQPNGLESRRGYIWRYTDPDRCGLLSFAFDAGWGEGTAYERYTQWALDVPMFFIQRDGHHVPLGGKTFRAYLQEGHEGFSPTMADWNLHLTTLFPEVRVKRVLEVRGADAVPPGLVCALPALWKGLLYDASALNAAWSRVSAWTHAQVDQMHREVVVSGLKAQAPDAPLLALAREITDLAAAGLRQQGARNAAGEDESLFLEPLYEIIERGTSPGRDLLERWAGSWSQRAELLVEFARY
jgi:glutamate--cysteine ligase